MNIFKRQFFIYPEIQKPLLKQVFFGLTLLSMIQALGVYLAMKWMANQVAADISLVVDYRVLGTWKIFLYAAILIPMVLNLIIGLCIVLYTSNKFAGPLFRLEREIDRYLNKETDKVIVNFRTHDHLHSLAQKINKMSAKQNS